MRFSANFSKSYMLKRGSPMTTTIIPTVFCFENAPNLSEITSDINYFRALAHKRHSHEPLKKLTLRFDSNVINMPFYTSPTYRVLPCLRCLKQLELEITVLPGASLLFWVFFAMACPFLSTFSVQFFEGTYWRLGDDGYTVLTKLPRHRKRVQKELNSYRHKHLKLVKLMDVVDQTNCIEFAVDLLHTAKSLEKLIIKPRSVPDRMQS